MRRVNEAVRQVLSEAVPELKDPRIGFVTVTGVDVLSPLLADACMDVMEPRIGAVGHSHVALSFHRDGDVATSGSQTDAGEEADLSSGEWLINPGAVGQPRDGDPRAAWLLLDTEAWTASWKRVKYDIEVAAEAIRDAGLPPALADRLYYGQ